LNSYCEKGKKKMSEQKMVQIKVSRIFNIPVEKGAVHRAFEGFLAALDKEEISAKELRSPGAWSLEGIVSVEDRITTTNPQEEKPA